MAVNPYSENEWDWLKRTLVEQLQHDVRELAPLLRGGANAPFHRRLTPSDVQWALTTAVTAAPGSAAEEEAVKVLNYHFIETPLAQREIQERNRARS